MTGLSQDEQDIVDTVREFVDREVRPVARELEHGGEYPGKLIDSGRGTLKRAIRVRRGRIVLQLAGEDLSPCPDNRLAWSDPQYFS